MYNTLIFQKEYQENSIINFKDFYIVLNLSGIQIHENFFYFFSEILVQVNRYMINQVFLFLIKQIDVIVIV